MGKLTLILGGARSGKSTYAEKLAASHGGRVLYIATAQALDEEMADRIENHKSSRPEEWFTLEAPRGISDAVAKSGIEADVTLLDCVTLLVTNLMMEDTGEDFEPDEGAAKKKIDEEVEELIEIAKGREMEWIVVSNEVGLGLVPPYPLGRVYRDVLGWANRKLADAADEVYFLVAGIPMPIHQFREE